MSDERARWRRFVWRWMALSAGLHLLAIVFSAGFYHSDEHFQILEFLRFRLFGGNEAALPVEYGEAMRPWLQPALYAAVLKTAQALGIQNPFDWALLFRLVSALAGWLSAVALCFCVPNWIAEPKQRRLAVVATALLWYLPALHARHSSENLSGSFFFLGLACIALTGADKSRGRALAAGFLWGCAVEFRYQVALMVLGAFAYFVRSRRLIPWGTLTAGFAGALALGTAADRWGYGTWTLTPWNYLRYNLVENHFRAADLAPVWDYYRRALTEAWPPLGLLLLLAFTIAWIRNPKHVLTWATLPLFAVHLAISHKELRFLFPIAHAGGLLLALALRPDSWTKPKRALATTIGAWNIIALTATTLVPAWMPIRFQRAVTDRGITELYHLPGQEPYQILGLPMEFYRPAGLRERAVSTTDPVPAGGWFFYPKGALPRGVPGASSSCTKVFEALPIAPPAFLPRRWIENVTDWSLYRC